MGAVALFGLCLFSLVGCGSSPAAAPGSIPHFKVGKPYQVNGTWYYPQMVDRFEETGVASWYGDEFHGQLTANGEIYNMHGFSAAHPTLPLPSMVRVTNLENGRSIVVRVNDRGPFAKNRIIDLSKRAAWELGYYEKGTAEVEVEYLGMADLPPDQRMVRRTSRERFASYERRR